MIVDHAWYSWDLTEAFFILRTSEKTSFAKGKEIFFTYGKRSNAFLLQHYGFSLPFNVYDSLKIKVWADRGEEAKELQKSTATTEYRFKRHKLNEMALEFYRIKVLRNAPKFKFSRITSAFDARVEHAVLLHMRDLLDKINKRFTTTIA